MTPPWRVDARGAQLRAAVVLATSSIRLRMQPCSGKWEQMEDAEMIFL
jgi:hypothetical protein